jgi:hypothetical protein
MGGQQQVKLTTNGRNACKPSMQRLLNEKEEIIVTNLDKGGIMFSKKHLILAGQNLQDFFLIKTRKPIMDEATFINVQVNSSDPNKIQIDPVSVRISQ